MALVRKVLVLGFLALAACAGEDIDEEPTTESEAALAATAYQLSDEEALATRTRGDCELKAGDLVFHRSLSEQAGAIAYLTQSQLTHVGVVFKVAGAWNVYEAVGPVKITPLESWIGRGQGKKFAASRYKSDLPAKTVKALFEAGKPFYGKPYDLLFTEGDDKIYCSELALKMYERASVSLISFFWSSQFSGLWKRVDRLAGWSKFEQELASPADSSDEKLVKKIMAARGVDAREFASQVLVAPVSLSSKEESGGVFRQTCAFGTH
ncbi:MAG: hypothetical protein KIT84_32300 [Labilithrix sp.]|nr:hypothetical protein [Labilithrix sp.]MCW5815755.1 hypothetical protein [Labilithrix sp.]